MIGSEDEFMDGVFDDCSELLVVRLDGSVIACGTFDVIDDEKIEIEKLFFRQTIKNMTLTEYWLTRVLKRQIENNTYLQFLLDS